MLWREDWIGFAPVDFDRDGMDDVLAIISKDWVQGYSQQLKSNLPSYLIEPDSFVVASIVGGLDADHLWVTTRKRDSLFLWDIVRKRRM
ncbi:MAG: hypothetical protein ABIK62_06520, partial [candidate division WOR-3 bacterium]